MEMHEALALLKRTEELLGIYIDTDETPEMCAFAELRADIEEALFNRAGVDTACRKHD